MVQPTARHTLKDTVFGVLPPLIVAAAVPSPWLLRADTWWHERWTHDDAFTRVRLRDADDAYRALVTQQGDALQCLLYNVRHTSYRRWWYGYASEAGAYADQSLLVPPPPGLASSASPGSWAGMPKDASCARLNTPSRAHAIRGMLAEHSRMGPAMLR